MKKPGTVAVVRQAVLCAWALAWGARPAAAATIFVATDGSDATGSGAYAAPFRTLNHALQQAVSGDVVEVRGGTYRETGEVRFRNPGIALRSTTGEWATIEAPLDDEAGFSSCVQIDPDADGTTLSRLEIAGGYYYGIVLQTKWDWGDPEDRSGACGIAIEDCVVRDTGRDGIKITPNCDDVRIRRCEIFNTGVGPANAAAQNAEGIDCVNGDRVTVQDCSIHDAFSTGIYLKGGSADGLVERTRVERCGAGGILLGFDTSPEYFDLDANPGYYENVRGTVRNCLVRDTAWEGIGLYAASNPAVFNNTLANVCTDNVHAALYFGLSFQDWDESAGRPASVNPAIYNNLILQPAGFTDETFEIRSADDLGGMRALEGWPTMDHNGYFVAGGGVPRFTDRRPGTELDQAPLAQWQAHSGADLHSRTADPLARFGADPALLVSSPYVDAGTNLAGLAGATDLTGRIRVQGAAVDVGAYETGLADWTGLVVNHAALAGATNPPAAVSGKVGQLRWFFSHASVGGNLVTGLNVLNAEDPVRFPLRIYGYDGDDGDGAYHGAVGMAGTEGGADYRAAADPASASNGFVYECMRGNPDWRN
ncbi:MAG: right-handed parallel beta-helix repeat-containing protein, partial [Kiritimatiellia bacterium]